MNASPQLYFHGLKIREAVVRSLVSLYGLASATDLVIGGCSAGGLAAYLHVDWYASQIPNAKTRGFIDSGFFLDGDYQRDGKPDYDSRMANLYQFMNASASISPACNAQLGYKCLFAYHLLPFIETPVLDTNSAYDATMGDGQCGAYSGITFDWSNATSVNACGNYIRGLMRDLLAPPNAVFLDSCQHHCGEWGQIHMDGLTGAQALAQWYANGSWALPGNGYMDQNQTYPCQACCNS